MANVFDVAKYILRSIGEVSTMKLQKLCYYSQALSLSEKHKHLFEEDFEAWSNGPVCRDLFNIHKGKFLITTKNIQNNLLSKSLTIEQTSIIDEIIDKLGKLEGYQLSEKSHNEDPWIKTRNGKPIGEFCNKVIKKTLIEELYNKDLIFKFDE